MAFPIIPGGMWSGQGSTTAPNSWAKGTVTANVGAPKFTNMPNAYDGDPTTYADLSNTDLITGTGFGSSGGQTQEAIFSHSPATGLVASSFLYLTMNLRVNVYLQPNGSYPAMNLVATLNGTFSDTSPIVSATNPYTILSIPANAGPNTPAYSASFNGKVQIIVDQFAPLTLDLYAMTLSLKWVSSSITTPTFTRSNVFGCRIYDISYIYL